MPRHSTIDPQPQPEAQPLVDYDVRHPFVGVPVAAAPVAASSARRATICLIAAALCGGFILGFAVSATRGCPAACVAPRLHPQ
jgi:hypothetical protein